MATAVFTNRNIIQNSLIVANIWATFVRNFIALIFQKWSNMVTLSPINVSVAVIILSLFLSATLVMGYLPKMFQY